MSLFGVIMMQLNDLVRADEFLQKALVIQQQVLGDVHHEIAATLSSLGVLDLKLEFERFSPSSQAPFPQVRHARSDGPAEMIKALRCGSDQLICEFLYSLLTTFQCFITRI